MIELEFKQRFQVPEQDLFQVVLEISRGTWGTVTARIKVRDQGVPNRLLDVCPAGAYVTGDLGRLWPLSLAHWSLLKSRQKPESVGWVSAS